MELSQNQIYPNSPADLRSGLGRAENYTSGLTPNLPEKSGISPATGISDVRETRGRKPNPWTFTMPSE